MATSSLVKDRRAEWIAIVERHLQLENAHGVEAARRVSRAYEAIGEGWDFSDSSAHHSAGFGAEAWEVMAGFRG